MKKIYNFIKLFSVLCILAGKSYGQCISTSQFGGGTVGSAAPGTSVTLSTCNYGGEYAPTTFNATGAFTFSSSVSTDYITITDASNNVLVFGLTPLAATIPSVGMYYVHFAASGPPACTAQSVCRTTSVFVPLLPCAGTPTAGAVPASFSICPNTSAVITATGATAASGITYQWMQSSSSTGPFTNVTTGSGFNTSSLTTASLTTLTFYQLVVTCSASAQSATSSVVSVNPNSPANVCYCNQNLGGSGCSGDNITNVSILNTPLNNSSTCNTNATNGTYTQFPPAVGTTATLNIGLTYTISVNTTASNIESVWIDYNQSGTFDVSEHTQITLSSTANSATTATFTIPGSALIGQTGMRVRSRGTGNQNGPGDACTVFGSGETEDYIVTIGTAAPCSGAPGANSVVATTTAVCPNGSVTLNLANSYTVGGLTYQWYTSTTSTGPYTAVSGATTSIYTATNVTTSLFYTSVITCTNGPASTTATPVQVIISTNPCQCASYCASNATSTLYDEIYNVSISTLSNTSNCGQTGGPGSILNEYSNYAGLLSAPNLIGGVTYSLGVTVGQCGVTFANSGIVTAYIDYNNNGLFTDAGELVYTSPYTSFLPAGTTVTANITIPTTITPGIRRMRIIEIESSVAQAPCGTYFAGETEDYCVNLMSPVACAGAPGSNTSIATMTNVCPNGTVTVSLANSYTVGGLTYQWYTSTTSTGPYTAVSGATNSAYTSTNTTASLFYQAVITCTNGPASTTSTPVQILVGGSPCQCAAYCPSAASNINDEEIFNVSIGTLNNTSNCSQTGGTGSILRRYSNYAGILAAPNLTVANNYTLNVTVGQCNTTAYSGGVTAYIDFNQNGLFTDPGELVFASALTTFSVVGTPVSTVITIPAAATPGTTRMRVIAVESTTNVGPCAAYTWGETEDYCVNIMPGTPCAGAPATNSAVASLTAACPNGSVTLSLANSYTLGGLTYQWYTSTTSTGPYTAVSGATMSIYTATNVTTSLFYTAVITCTNGPASTTATPVQVIISTNPCQCTPYCASNATSTLYDEIYNVSIGTLNNTSNCGQTGGAGSILNEYSNYAGLLAAPNLIGGVTYSLGVTVGQCGVTFANSGIVTAYIDYNNNGLFTDAGELVYTSPYTSFLPAGTTVTANITIPTTITPGIRKMRVIEIESSVAQAACGTYFAGETEDYCVNLVGPVACAGAPGSNSAVASPSAACPNGTVTLSLANTYTVGGLTYQWYTSTSATGPYTAVSGATNTIYTATNVTTALFYQAVITCTNGPASTTSTPVQVTINNNPCQCVAYCASNATSTFDDEIFNVSIGTLSNTTNCSQTGSAPTSTLNLYSNYTGILAAPTLSTNSTYTLSVTAGQCNATAYSGIVTAYIDFNQNGLFTDPGELVISTTYTPLLVTGITFNTLVTIPANATAGTTRMRVIAAEVSFPQASCGTYGYGETEDYCVVIQPGCAAPTISVSASSTVICSGNSASLTASGATTYSLNNVATTNPISVTPSVTTTYTVSGENTPGCAGTKTISINVNASPSLAVSPNPTICPGMSTVLSATSSANNYTWSPGNFTTAAISVTPAISNVYNVVTTNSLGCSTNSNVTVFVVVCTGIAKNTVIDNSTFIYPNPNNGNINVVIEAANGNYTFEILDLSGRLVYKTTLTKAESALNIKDIANGMYTYRITSLTSKASVKEGKLIKE